MPWPTIFNTATGKWEEINDEEAQAEYGIPIGEPVPSGLRPTGGPEMPGNEPPPYYSGGDRESLASTGGKPQLWASTERGVPAGYSNRRPLPSSYVVEPDTEDTSGGYVSGLASEFGYNDLGNPAESHVGAWNNDISSREVAGVALPEADLVKHFGSTKDARDKMVEVKVGDKTGVFPIVDVGPGEGVVARQGPTIDLTYGAARQLGHSGGLDKAEYKILKPLSDDYKVDSQQEAEQPLSKPLAAGGPPPGAKPLSADYSVVEPGVIDAIDPRAPYMAKPRDPQGVHRIIMHGDVNEDADALIKYGRKVDPDRGFAPGYHFYVARDGTVKQGAPVDRITNHTLGENSDSIGINVAGADEGKMPTEAQVKATKHLISQLGRQYNIDPSNVIGHGELQPNRRNELEGGTIAKEIREQGYETQGPPPGAKPLGPEYKVEVQEGQPSTESARQAELAAEVGMTPREKLERRAQGYVDSLDAKSGTRETPPTGDTSMGEPRSTDYAPGIGPVPTAGSAAEYHPGMGPGVRGGDVVYDEGGPRRPVPPEAPGKVYRWTETPGTREPGAPTRRRRTEELPMVTEKMATDLGLTDWRDLDAGGRVVRRAEFAGKGTGVSKEDYEARQKALAEPGAEVGATEMAAKRAERYPERLPEVTTEGLVKSEAPMANLVPSGARKFIQGKVIEPAEQWLLQHGPGTGFATEAAQRAAKEVPGGGLKAVKGIRTGELAAGEALQEYTENRYSRMQDPVAFAKADLPRLHAELDAQRVKTASMRNRGYMPESQETTYRYGIGDQQSKVKQSVYQEEMKKEAELVRTLRQAEDAAEGNLGRETFSDKLLNAAGDQMVKEGKRSLPDINKKLEAWNDKWASYIDKKWDSDETIQFVESASQNAAVIAPSLVPFVGPLASGVMMFGQNVEANEKEITEKLKKAGKPINEEEVRKEASLRAVDQTVEEYPGAIFLTKYLRNTLKALPANWAKQTPAVKGKWFSETAKDLLPELFQETMVTTPVQDLISRQRNEAMGISKPLTHEEAAATTLASMGQAALQTVGLGAGGAVTTKVSEAAGEARARRMADKFQQQKEPTSTERQEQAKATMKPGTYRNFADIPAEPTAVEKPGAPPTIPAEAPAPTPTGTIPAAPAAPAAEPVSPGVTGKTLNDVAPMGNLEDRKGYMKRRKAEGATTEEAAAELSAENDQMKAKLDAATPEGSQIQDPETGRIYQKEPDGAWKGVEKGDVKGLTLDPNSTIVRVGYKGETAPAPAGPTIPPIAPAKPEPTIPVAPAPVAEEGPTPEALAKVAEYEQASEGKPSGAPLTSAGRALQFEDESGVSPERSAQLERLGSSLAQHPMGGGQPVKLVPVRRQVRGTTQSKTLDNAITGLEKLFNKRVQFVRSGSGETLPFTGLTDPSDPNTIFLDAAGDRNVLALIGHEWGHTLKASNPQLHGEMVKQMKSLVKEEGWGKQEAELRKEKYPEKEVSDEVASNHIGDAFADPDFWKHLNKKNPSLFKRAVKAVNDFFKSLVKRARDSEWGTEKFVTDLKAMHKIIADAIDQAVTKGPEPKAAPKEAEGPKFAPRETKEEKPSLKAAMEGEKAEKLKEKMGGLRFAGRRETEPVAPREFAMRKHGFYSKLEQTVIDKIPKSATPEQTKATIAGAQLKAEEIKWSGVNQAVDRIASENGGKVPKDKLLQYLRDDGAVRLEEVTLGQAGVKARERKQDLERQLSAELPRKAMDAGMSQLDAHNLPWQLQDGRLKVEDLPKGLQSDAQQFLDAWKAWTAEGGKTSLAPRFQVSNLILPGGENYREVVLAMPGRKQTFEEYLEASGFKRGASAIEQQAKRYGYDATERINNLREGYRREYEAGRNLRDISEYTSSHFPDVPNYVAHARMNDRTDADGKPGTFLEEIQSDRHQQGRERGYAGEVMEYEAYYTTAKHGDITLGYGKTAEEARANVPAQWAATDTKIETKQVPSKKEGIPDAPFRKDWPVQMFKRALRDAVAEGKKWIGWTNGETQAERYDLSKQVESVTVERVDVEGQGPRYDVRAKGLSGDQVIHEAGLSAPELSNTIGKDLAKQSVEGLSKDGDRQTFKGEGLKVGGEGMKDFYDNILPKMIGEYVRKGWDAKVEKSEIANEEEPRLDRYSGRWYFPSDQNGPNFATKKEAWDSQSTVPIWKVEITPAMEKGVSEGQPLFATRRKAKSSEPTPTEPGERSKPEPGPRVSPFFHYGSHKEAAYKGREEFREQWEKEGHPIVRAVKGAKFAFDEYMYDRLHLNTDAFYQSTQQKFDEMGLGFLSAAMRKHIDRRSALAGKYGEIIHRARMSVPPWHRKQADAEYGKYWRLNQTKGRDAANKYYRDEMSDGGKKFVDVSHKVYPELGHYAATMKEGLKIRNSETGRWEDFQEYKSDFKDYHPHRLQEKFQRAMDDPDAYPAAYDEMMDIMQGEGLTELQAKEKLSAYKAADADNGFFGSLERKRVADLPSQLYDYSFAGLTDYVASFADRIAQVEAYGQGKGKDNTGTVWDEAINRAGNEETRGFIRDVMNQAYGQKAKTKPEKAMMTLGNLLSGLQLGHQVSAIRNLISGEAMNMSNYGFRRWALTLPSGFSGFGKDVYERGVLQRDFYNIMHDGEQAAQGGIAKRVQGFTKAMLSGEIPILKHIPVVGQALKYSSQTASEAWVRGHSVGLAKLVLRDAIKNFEKNPRSSASREALAYFKHLGFEGTSGQDLIAEGGEGEMFDRYLREATVDVQTGYTFNRLPLFMSTPAGKIFGKYGPWGLEQLSRMQNRVTKPAIRAITFGRLYPETVKIVNEHGEQETMKVPGSLMPLARYIVALAAAGGATEELLEFFGIQKRTATLAQILATASTDQMKALSMFAEKSFMYLVSAGAGGTLGTTMQTGMDAVNRSRGKNPLNAPAFSFLDDAVMTARDIMDQGNVEGTARSVGQWLNRNVGAARTATQFANMPGRINNAWSAPIPYLRKQAALQDVNWLKGYTRRYDKEHGIKAPLVPERPTKTPTSALKENVYEDVLIGDSGAAKERIREFKKGKPEDVRGAIDEQVKDTLSSRQPIKAGGGSEAGRADFLKWMKKSAQAPELGTNLPVIGDKFTGEEDVARVKRINDTYRKTARKVYTDLFPDETPKYKSMTDYMRKMDLGRKANRPETLSETVHYPASWPAAPEPFGAIVWQK